MWRIGVMSLPTPKEMGEAYMCAFVTKKNDRDQPLLHARVRLRARDKQARTIVCGREGQRTIKHGDGPALTGDFQADATAFVDALLEVIAPTKASPGRSYDCRRDASAERAVFLAWNTRITPAPPPPPPPPQYMLEKFAPVAAAAASPKPAPPIPPPPAPPVPPVPPVW